MKNSWLALAIIIFLLPISPVAAQEQHECNPAIDYYQQGNNAIAQRDAEEALQAFACAIELDQKPVASHILRGYIFSNIGDYDNALAEADYALALDPNEPRAYSVKGEIFLEQGLYQQAIEAYSTAIELGADEADADFVLSSLYASLGTAYAFSEEYDEALANYNQAILLDPEYALAYASRGFVYDSLNNDDLAATDLEIAKELDPNLFSIYLESGIADFELGYHERSMMRFTQAIQLSPPNALAVCYVARGRAYFQLEEYDLAIADFNHAIESDPGFASAYNGRGSVYAAQGNHEQAIMNFTRAIELDPTLYEAFNNRSISYAALGETELADADREHYFANEGTTIAQHNIDQGNAYLEMGEYDGALAHFIGALLFDPESAEAYLGLGHVAYAQGDFPTAPEAYEMYLDLAGDDADPAIVDRVEEIKDQID